MIERITPPGVAAPRAAPTPRLCAPAISSSSPARSRSIPPPRTDLRRYLRRNAAGAEQHQGSAGGCGATIADVVRCGVFLGDGKDFAAMNAVYAEFFGDAKPARATVVTGFAAPGIHVEIEAIAYKPC